MMDVYILRALHRRFTHTLGRRFQKTLEHRGVPVQEKEVVAMERLGGCRVCPLKNATTPNLPESSSRNQDGMIPGWRIGIDTVFLKDEEATRLSGGFIGWIMLICMMTRAYLNWPVKSRRGVEVIEALFYWARFFGFPVIIVCNLAKEFTDGVFPAFCAGWETSGLPHHILIEEAIPYIKGQMGRTERANRISREALAAYMYDPTKKFPVHVWHLVCMGSAWAVMCVYSISLGMTAFEAMTGCEPPGWMLGDLAVLSIPGSGMDPRGQYVTVLTPLLHEQWAVMHLHPLDRVEVQPGVASRGHEICTVLRVYVQQLSICEFNLMLSWLTPEERLKMTVHRDKETGREKKTLELRSFGRDWEKYSPLFSGGSGRGKKYGVITGGLTHFARPDKVLQALRYVPESGMGPPTEKPGNGAGSPAAPTQAPVPLWPALSYEAPFIPAFRQCIQQPIVEGGDIPGDFLQPGGVLERNPSGVHKEGSNWRQIYSVSAKGDSWRIELDQNPGQGTVVERSLSPSQRCGPTLKSDPPISGPPPSGGVAPPPAFDSPSTSPERSNEEEVSRGNMYGARDAPQAFEQMFRGLLTGNAEAVWAAVEMGNRWSPGGPQTSGGAQPMAKVQPKAKASPSPPQERPSLPIIPHPEASSSSQHAPLPAQQQESPAPQQPQ